MQYNSNQEKLIFPEYGRNVQSMIRVVRNEADSKKRWNNTDSKALVTVYFKNINKLESASNGNTSGAINEPNSLTLSLNNNGSTTLDLNAVSVNATLNCNGNVKFTGAATQAKIKNNNNGSFIAKDFKTVSLSLKNDANGSTSVFASSQIDIESSANGNLSYYGNQSKKTIKNDGNGSVSAK